MPWGWECKQKFVKQNPTNPTKRRGKSAHNSGPTPFSYEIPQIYCGKGYSKIKRAPAFTFGHLIPIVYKPVLAKNAPMLDVTKYGPKGQYKIKHGIVSPVQLPQGKSQTPGPGAYAPRTEIQFKRPPAYTMTRKPPPPYQSKTDWKPAPIMYLPYKPTKAAPAYTFGNVVKECKKDEMPNPGDYDPKFDYVLRTTPGFSIGPLLKALKLPKVPAPNAYCEKKFMYPKLSIPARSFGIHHSPHLGKENVYLTPSNLKHIVCED